MYVCADRRLETDPDRPAVKAGDRLFTIIATGYGRRNPVLIKSEKMEYIGAFLGVFQSRDYDEASPKSIYLINY